jgi:23S rRNA (adenine2503-C2)-methyltransferase
VAAAEPLIGMDAGELAAALDSEPPYRARQLYRALYRERVTALDSVTTLPAPLRRRLAGTHPIGLPRAAATFRAADGATRYLFALADGRTVETVLMPEERRDTICISTQVGCAVDCKFCLTALMGLERNLTAGEIVGQVLAVMSAHRLRPESRRLNVVMMGQGEPLLNLENVVKATRLLADPRGVGLSERRLTLSTAGVIPKIAELGREKVRPKLAVSLNASGDAQRREIMPITRKYPVADLMAACRAYPLRPWERLTFEYVLLGGFNDSDADARRLVRLIGQLKCKVNLIAWNPGPELGFATPPDERVESFRAIVARSVPCFVRQPRGREIYAACGQLKRMSGEAVVTLSGA